MLHVLTTVKQKGKNYWDMQQLGYDSMALCQLEKKKSFSKDHGLHNFSYTTHFNWQNYRDTEKIIDCKEKGMAEGAGCGCDYKGVVWGRFLW